MYWPNERRISVERNVQMLQSPPSNIQGELYSPSNKSTLDLEMIEEPVNVDKQRLTPAEPEDIEIPPELTTTRLKRAK